jgi:Uncharacterized protein conserved in bacteria (DUF2219).
MRACYLLFLLLYTTHLLSAQTPRKLEFSDERAYNSYALFTEQDAFVHPLRLDEDRNYTMGIGFFFGSNKLRQSWLMAPVKWISAQLFIHTLHQRIEAEDDKPFTYSLMLANGSFTPDNLAAPSVITNDRPYGNITYIQQNLTRVNASMTRKYAFSFIIGLLGSYVSREVKTEIHSWYNENDTKYPRTPRGWNHQISNGGGLTVALTRSNELLLTKKALKNERLGKFNVELKHGWKYSVGYYTAAQYGFGMRLGWLDPANWTFDLNPLSNSNKFVKENEISKRYKGEFYLIAGARPVFMLYNALLNGQFRKSDHSISFQNTRHFLFEWDLGAGGRIPFSQNTVLDIRLKMLSGRTPEFKLRGREPRTHYWGSIELILTHFNNKTK